PVFPLRHAGIDWNPTQRAANTPGLTPVEPRLLELLTARNVFTRNALYRMAMQPQLFVRTLRVLLNIVGRQKHTLLFDRAVTEFVHIVPDKVNRPCHLVQQRTVLVFDSNFEGLGVFSHTVYITSALQINQSAVS